jgi:hypothetical protein
VNASSPQNLRVACKAPAQASEVLALPEDNVAEDQNRKKKIAIFVEPSPFSHVSGIPIL